jgi:hypothetical protein
MGTFGMRPPVAIITSLDITMLEVAKCATQPLVLTGAGFQKFIGSRMAYFAMKQCDLAFCGGQRLMNLMTGCAFFFQPVAVCTIHQGPMGSIGVTITTLRNVVCNLRTMTLVAFQTCHLFLVSHTSRANLPIFKHVAFFAVLHSEWNLSLCCSQCPKD